ncbi:2,3-dihydroxybiphenyl 1,2-dioxygenase [Halobacteriales archaeon QS_1_68_17]|nr:MAG: 2,3-dihydroxybiphenyl 1,2-dioxygenase [Halobacteriales archaeon QS_1_68_17]
MGIATLGHVELRCTDVEASRDHFHDVLGMEESLREDGRIYMRAWGDWDTFTLALVPAGESAVGHVAFQVEEPADLDRYADRIERAGHEVEWLDPGADPGQGEAIRFTEPGGHRIELYHEMERADVPPEKRSDLKNQPQVYVDRGVGVRRIDHVNLKVPDVDASTEWFREVLEFELREQLVLDGDRAAAWLSVSPLVHEVAFVDADESALNHLAYYLKAERELYRAVDVLKDNGVEILEGPGHHGISQAMFLYHDEPSGNEIEVFAGGYLIFDPNWEPVTWTEEDLPEAVAWWGETRPFSGADDDEADELMERE